MSNYRSIAAPILLLVAALLLLGALTASAQWVTFPELNYFEASPSPVGMTDPPSETELHWIYTNVDTCTGTGFSAADTQIITVLDPNGSGPGIAGMSTAAEGYASVPVAATTTFSITCTGPSKTVTDSVTVAPSPMYFGVSSAAGVFDRFYSAQVPIRTWSAQGTIPYGSTPNLPTQKTCETLANEAGLPADTVYWCVEAHDYNAPSMGLCVYTCQGGGDVSAGSSPGDYSYKTTLYTQQPVAYSRMLINPDGSVTYPNPNPPPSGTDTCVGSENFDPYRPGTWSCNLYRHVQPVTAASPNLTAGAITPATATAGTAVTLSATVLNNSTTTATASGFTNLFQRATDASGTNATDIGTDTSPALAASATDVTQLAYTFPSAGTWYVRVCADKSSAASTGTITESNETDNCGAWSQVTVSAAFVLSCSVNPSSITAGQNVTWSATPANLGTYTWTPSEGGSAGGSGATLNRTYGSAGTYSMSVTAGGQTASCPQLSVGGACSNPSISLEATPDRLTAGSTTTITWTASGIAGSCTVTGTNGYSSGPLTASSCGVTGSTNQTVTTQTTFVITCDGTTDTTIVNVIPRYEEF